MRKLDYENPKMITIVLYSENVIYTSGDVTDGNDSDEGEGYF